MIEMKMSGTARDGAEDYLNARELDFRSYFGAISDWKRITASAELRNIRDEIVAQYPLFHEGNLGEQLKRYRIDYILATDETSARIEEFPFVELAERFDPAYLLYRVRAD